MRDLCDVLARLARCENEHEQWRECLMERHSNARVLTARGVSLFHDHPSHVSNLGLVLARDLLAVWLRGCVTVTDVHGEGCMAKGSGG